MKKRKKSREDARTEELIAAKTICNCGQDLANLTSSWSFDFHTQAEIDRIVKLAEMAREAAMSLKENAIAWEVI